MEWEGKEFVQGIWYAVEQLIIWCDGEEQAKWIIEESNIQEWEFREVLKETKYQTERLTEFLDEVFKKEEA